MSLAVLTCEKLSVTLNYLKIKFYLFHPIPVLGAPLGALVGVGVGLGV
jgi:hypothetical protein